MQTVGKKRRPRSRESKKLRRETVSRGTSRRRSTPILQSSRPTPGTATSEAQADGSSRDMPTSEKQMRDYAAFLGSMFQIGVGGYLKQYDAKLHAYVPPSLTHDAFDKNMERNRYKDVVCADFSRVVLRGVGNTYIHANYVAHPALVNRFICTQGPMGHTAGDFWSMVLQENVGVIVMLCECVEQGKEKCQQYWPLNAGDAIQTAGIVIANENTDRETNRPVVITTLRVSRGNDTRVVRHHQWKNWPDRGVPQSVRCAFRILNEARKCVSVVHCSAGVGRTGTVVALEVCLQKLLTGEKLCVTSTIRELRMQRAHLVQTDLQLLFICKSLTAFSRALKEFSTPELQAMQAKFYASYDALIEARTKPEAENIYSPLVPL